MRKIYRIGLGSDGVGKRCPVDVLWIFMIAKNFSYSGIGRGAGQYGADLQLLGGTVHPLVFDGRWSDQ